MAYVAAAVGVRTTTQHAQTKASDVRKSLQPANRGRVYGLFAAVKILREV